MWGRFMDRLLAETKVEERFTEHDLRAKCASDAGSLEHARALLAHADARTTETAPLADELPEQGLLVGGLRPSR
jgi:integrase